MLNVTYHPYILHFKEPAGTSRGVYLHRKVWYVIISEVNTPHFGIGECAPLPHLSCDDVPEYEQVLAHACSKLSADGQIPYSLLQPFPSILFGMETAMLSLQASRAGRSPLWLHDNAFTRGEEGITINGLVWMGKFEDMLQRMQHKVDQGFKCVKIKVGAIDWQQELELIRVLRKRFAKETIELRLDANGGFSTDNVLKRLHDLAPYGIHSIEQPIAPKQWAAMARICRESPIPIALDEELIGVNSSHEKAHLLDSIRPQYIILKPSLHGAFSGCEEWIRLACERHIGYWATSALESNIGLNAIAQWCAQKHLILPQGLGTGQLFSDNTSAPQLDVIGEQLWNTGGRAQQEFEREVEEFRHEWCQRKPTVQVHTSGSTGLPQPMEVEKTRMEASAKMTLRFLHLQPGDRALLCLPLKYIAGKMMVVRAMVGGLHLKSVCPSSHPFRALAQILRLLPESAVGQHPFLPHFVALTPMQAWNTLQDVHERTVLAHIPHIIIGGGPVSTELHDALQYCKGEVYSTYGMTETLSHIAMRRLNGPLQDEWYSPLSGVEISLSPNRSLVIHAPSLSKEKLFTHDIAEINGRGQFRILGRTDNIITSGGIKISPEILEQRIGMIGIPYMFTAVQDPVLGQALTLLYSAESPDITPNAVIARLEGSLSRYERPRYIFNVSALPFTETGKPARARAQAMAEKLVKDAADN